MRTLFKSLILVCLIAFSVFAGAQPEVVGQWGPVMRSQDGNWLPSLYTIQAVHLPTGKILFWGYRQQAPQCQIWDPGTGSFTQVDPRSANSDADPFCSGHCLLSDGSVLTAGGHIQDYTGQRYTLRFDPFNSTWQPLASMKYPRWYPTCTTLPDGRVLTMSGMQYIDTVNQELIYDKVWADYPEIYDPVSNTWTVLPDWMKAHWYPFMFVLPNGKVLYCGRNVRTSYPNSNTSYTLDVKTNHWAPVAQPQLVQGGNAVQYLPGKIMKCGGEDPTQPGAIGCTNTVVLDMNATTPSWRSTAPMAQKRRDQNLVILPDGKVLAVGGSLYFDQPPTGSLQKQAEMWDPNTETWTAMASMNDPRCYHSVALLLADGRVYAGGGNLSPTGQIYSPPYLFKGNRPVITLAPERANIGATFDLLVDDTAAVEKVVLVGLSAVTHAFDQNQRYVPLTFLRIDSTTLTVNSPANFNLAPPGYYMVFALNAQGVPSIAKYIKITSSAMRSPGKSR